MTRLATSLVVLALLLPTVVAWVYFVALAAGGQASPWQQAVYSGGKVVQFGLPLLWLLVARRWPRWPERPGAGWGTGLLFGLVVSAALLALYYGGLRGSPLLAEAPQRIQEKVRELGVETPWRFLGLAAFLSLIHSGLEEYYWRWFVFGRLEEFLSPRVANGLAAVGFTAHHTIVLGVYFPGQWLTAILPLSLAITAGGVFWAWLYRRSGSLIGPWLGHGLIDAAIFVVGWDLLHGA